MAAAVDRLSLLHRIGGPRRECPVQDRFAGVSIDRTKPSQHYEGEHHHLIPELLGKLRAAPDVPRQGHLHEQVSTGILVGAFHG
jgi:hypothetical protein